MTELTKLIDFIGSFCNAHALHIEKASKENFRIRTDEASGISLILDISIPSKFSFYFLERTHDVVYGGDRSDAHVILSLMFATFLKASGFATSCSLYDIPHPVVPGEVWGRYIMPEQSSILWGITDWDEMGFAVNEVLLSIVIWRDVFWEIAGCPCAACLRENSIDDNSREYTLPSELDHNINKLLKSTPHLNSGARMQPKWSYFYDIKNEITIIKSEALSEFLESLKKFSKPKVEIVRGRAGDFILQGELKNYITDKNLNELKKMYFAVKEKINREDIAIYPLENMLVSVAKPYIIALGRPCGLYKFRNEREILRVRHNRESELLFPVASFKWNEQVPADQFESLIKALLEREPNVISVRKASPTNQGDGGRDILIEWNVRNVDVASEHRPPTLSIKVVGQCKSSSKSVGKNKVLDIRDTIESHNAQGYFLAVSSQLSAPLTKKLEELKEKGIWTEWWNRDDIEVRLSRNQDLLPLFSTVVKAKHQIKFVEQKDNE